MYLYLLSLKFEFELYLTNFRLPTIEVVRAKSCSKYYRITICF